MTLNSQPEEITPGAVVEWLADQRLVYASWPVRELRLRLLYLPSDKRWEVWYGANKKLYSGNSLVDACRVFNQKVKNE